MATYIAHDAQRKTITLMLSKAEASALLEAALYAEESIGDGLPMNGQTKAAYGRATDALAAATNTNARRAGFF